MGCCFSSEDPERLPQTQLQSTVYYSPVPKLTSAAPQASQILKASGEAQFNGSQVLIANQHPPAFDSRSGGLYPGLPPPAHAERGPVSYMTGPPRYFLGSAWHQTTWDLAHKQEEWSSLQHVVGYHNHPMGWHGQAQAKGYGAQLLGAFRQKWFTLEADLHDTCACNLRNNPFAFGNDLKLVGSEWQCAAFMPWVNAERMVNDLENQAALYKEIFLKVQEKDCTQNYIFWAPPSPEGQANYDRLMSSTKDGLPLWVWLARESGAVGIAIDHPAQQWQHNPELRPLGLKVGQDCQLYGLKFIWVVNGTATRSQTAALAEDVRRSGISVHHWIVDQFASQEYPGTPEWSESASGQMKVLVDGLY